MGNFSALGVKLAIEMLASVFLGMTAREYARARAAAHLGDPTPRLWGRVSIRTKPWFDPFGSGLIPALIAVLWAVGITMVPAAYGKAAPVDPGYLRRQPRDTILVSVAGPGANLLLAILAGVLVRIRVFPTQLDVALVVFSFTNSALMVFHLLPIPGLDGARMVALLLPPGIRDAYRNFDPYLPLIVLLVLFLLGGMTLGILDVLAGAVCQAATGVSCR